MGLCLDLYNQAHYVQQMERQARDREWMIQEFAIEERMKRDPDFQSRKSERPDVQK